MVLHSPESVGDHATEIVKRSSANAGRRPQPGVTRATIAVIAREGGRPSNHRESDFIDP
jgi:hypothetical protein